ncbi:MAG: hypothetical protein HW421_31 [Ignavibacteria bacterium]|nr:hypothetical protein [Ignavibacteria bacterium]
MKTKFILLFLLAIFTLLNNSELKAQCDIDPNVEDCYDAGGSGAWTEATETIRLPDWNMLCPVTIDFCWRQVSPPPNHQVQLFIKKIHVPSNPECNGLRDYLNVNDDALAAHNANYLKQLVQNALTLNLFLYMWEHLTTQEEKNSYLCPGGPSGSDPNALHWRTKYFFEDGLCQAWCRVYQPVGLDDDILLVPKACTEAECCKITIRYCVTNPNTNPPTIMMVKTYDGQSAPSCHSIQTPYIECPAGVEVTYLSCKSNCQELHLND